MSCIIHRGCTHIAHDGGRKERLVTHLSECTAIDQDGRRHGQVILKTGGTLTRLLTLYPLVSLPAGLCSLAYLPGYSVLPKMSGSICSVHISGNSSETSSKK